MWWQEKNHLEIIDNHLYIGGKNVPELADEFGTPLFVYNIYKVIQNYRMEHLRWSIIIQEIFRDLPNEILIGKLNLERRLHVQSTCVDLTSKF